MDFSCQKMSLHHLLIMLKLHITLVNAMLKKLVIDLMLLAL